MKFPVYPWFSLFLRQALVLLKVPAPVLPSGTRLAASRPPRQIRYKGKPTMEVRPLWRDKAFRNSANVV